jgi:ankyrin repeat protein
MSAEDDFRKACFSGDTETALALVPRLDLAWRDPSSGWTLLHVAVEHRCAEVVEKLASVGVDLEAMDNTGWTPLCLAVDADIDAAAQAKAPCDLRMTRILVQLGCDPNGGRGTSPTAIAKEYGNSDALRLLTHRSAGRVRDFQLVDLVSQREAVRRHLMDWSVANIVAWLAERGELTKRSVSGRDVFYFRSTAGREAVFFFDGDEMVFVGDHMTF